MNLTPSFFLLPFVFLISLFSFLFFPRPCAWGNRGGRIEAQGVNAFLRLPPFLSFPFLFLPFTSVIGIGKILMRSHHGTPPFFPFGAFFFSPFLPLFFIAWRALTKISIKVHSDDLYFYPFPRFQISFFLDASHASRILRILSFPFLFPLPPGSFFFSPLFPKYWESKAEKTFLLATLSFFFLSPRRSFKSRQREFCLNSSSPFPSEALLPLPFSVLFQKRCVLGLGKGLKGVCRASVSSFP